MNAGFNDEALAWAQLAAARRRRRSREDANSLRRGRRTPASPSSRLAWLPGYGGLAPRRASENAAHEQFQLDTYGEMMDALHEARRHGLARDDHAWALQQKVDGVSSRAAWDQPDEGIWEVRGPRRHFTHSKVLAWVAFDRAVDAVETVGTARDLSSAGARFGTRSTERSVARASMSS